MQPNPDFHTSPNCIGTRVYGHRLEAGDVLEATDLYDSTSTGEWTKCPAPGITLEADAPAVWIRPLALPEIVEVSTEPVVTEEDDNEPVVNVIEYDGGKLIATYLPEENVVTLSVEGSPKLNFDAMAGLGSFSFQAAQFMVQLSGLSLEELMERVTSGCGEEGCSACGGGTNEHDA